MKQRQASVVGKVSLSKVPSIKNGMLRIFSNNGIFTLQDCAKRGTETLLMIEGVGIAVVISLRRECRKRDIAWNLSEYEKNSERGVEWETAISSHPYGQWMSRIIGGKMISLRTLKKASA